MAYKYERFTEDILEYLKVKLPHESIATVEEIAAYVGAKTTVLMGDIIADRDKEWRMSVDLALSTHYGRSADAGWQKRNELYKKLKKEGTDNDQN